MLVLCTHARQETLPLTMKPALLPVQLLNTRHNLLPALARLNHQSRTLRDYILNLLRPERREHGMNDTN